MKWPFEEYQYRLSITIDTAETIKDGLKCAISYLPLCISKDNKHDILITLGKNKKLLHIWDNKYGKMWEKYNEESIVLDDYEVSGYLISIPVPKNIGKVIYYIYYNISEKLDGNDNRLRISGIARSINQIKAIFYGVE